MTGHTELQAEAYYDQRIATDVAVSPSGDRVAYLVEEYDGVEDERCHGLYVAPTDGTESPHRLTRVSDAGAPAWSPDGRRLGFVAAREDRTLRLGRPDDGDEDDDSPDEEPRPQVWTFDLDRGGDARQVTDFEEGVEEFDWSPDGERVVVAARDPTDDQREYLDRREEGGPIETTRLQHKRDGAGWLDDVRTYLFVVDCETREATRLDEAYAAGSLAPLMGLQPRWGPTDRIAFVSSRAERPDDTHAMDVCVVDPDGSNLDVLTESELQANSPRWSPEGRRLSFVAGDPENWYAPSETYVADPSTGRYDSVSGSLDRTVAAQATPEWVGDDELVGAIADEGRTRLARFDADRDDPERLFDAQGSYREIAQFDVAGGTVALCLSAPDAPADVYAVDVADLDAGPDADPLVRVSEPNDGLLDGVEPPTCRRVTFENDDGVEIEGVAYLPPDLDPDDPEPRPVIASIHGGPMSYDAPEFKFDYVYWTSRGYVVLRTNYRGSTSYGRDFAESIASDWGPREVDDVVSGVESLVERGWGDPDRLFATGFSYGGITTAQLLTRTDAFAAGAAEHGIYDFYSVFGTSDSHPWHEAELGVPWENEEEYRKVSSLPRVGDLDAPLLVTAGGEDWRCPPSQAEQLYVSAKKQGVDAKLVVYPDEHHDIGAPDRAIHRLEAITEWFEDHDPGREQS
ncbi:S9 family peptidase [Halorussus halobius]|uniref:S9 family peptidase n=1 Tax=Halorussus halobius TaxID=1710537 RepID=UPI00109325EC|nr:S9 family peptidase [Halorussus halobius]